LCVWYSVFYNTFENNVKSLVVNDTIQNIKAIIEQHDEKKLVIVLDDNDLVV